MKARTIQMYSGQPHTAYPDATRFLLKVDGEYVGAEFDSVTGVWVTKWNQYIPARDIDEYAVLDD